MNKKYKLALLLLCSAGGTFAQTLSQAQKWFTNGEFDKAKPVFERLVKQSPSSANYNFWYGACCYETGELNKSLPYLKKVRNAKLSMASFISAKLIMTYTALMMPSLIWKIISTGWSRKNGIHPKQKHL